MSTMFGKPSNLICSNCNFKNSILYKKCRECGTILKKKVDRNITPTTNVVTKRVDTLASIYNGLNFIELGMNTISEDLLPFAQKYRWLYLLVNKATTGCSTCLGFLGLLIDIGKCVQSNEEYNVLMDTVNTQFETIKAHIESYEYNENSVQLIRFRLREFDVNDNEEELYETDITGPATPNQLKLIKSVPKDKIPDGEDDCCVICLDKLINETVSMLPCGHLFHHECIGEWLAKRNNCPIGRCPIKTLKSMMKDGMNKGG